jgi:hypothetical protein
MMLSTMRIYRLSDSSRLVPHAAPSLVNVRYFRSRRRALSEGAALARVYVSMYGEIMTWSPVDRYGIVGVWKNRRDDPDHEVRIEYGEIEDVPAEDA